MQTIIGVDCATQPTKVGLALAVMKRRSLQILESRTASRREPPAQIVAHWLSRKGNSLLALDAPLGWAASLSPALSGHEAGRSLGPASSDRLFRRLTDNEVHRRLGKRPLEIGADRISRTTVSALRMLDELRVLSGEPIPLAWDVHEDTRVRAIEVYPAATRIAHGVARRVARFEEFGRDIACSSDGQLRSSDDAEDAVVCTIAGFDFLMSRSVAPLASQERCARIEGWIWVPDRPVPA